ncbi:MAG TPA: hypothetical protein DCZ94_09085 [Lentisphaeria bacterium]|nr:MAG: hypothetical protein A2X48_18555 [Lentisphaerae bacterium GWF2_49_21]HBC87094.1 hypothetical protein [Lentisphaeria bacterium]
MALILGIASAFCLSPGLSAYKTVELSDRMKFSCPRFDSNYKKIQDFLKAADHVMQNFPGFKAAEKNVLCSVSMTNADLKDGYEISVRGGALVIMLADPDIGEFDRNFKVQSAVISSLLLCRFGISPEKNIAKVPGWMVAGFLYRSERKNSSISMPGIITYPAARMLCISMSEPDLWRLLDNPLDFSDGPSYRLYSENCAMLVEALTHLPGDGKDVFTALLKSAVADEKPSDSFRHAVGPVVKKAGFDFPASFDIGEAGKLVEEWYKTFVRNSSVNIFYPGTSGFAVGRLEKIEMISYEAVKSGKEEKTEWKNCGITELGGKWLEMTNPEKAVTCRQRCLSDLSNQLPSMFQKEMNGLIIALKNLKDGGKEDFAAEYGKARKGFLERAFFLKEIEDYLSEGEGKHVSFGTRYSVELKYLEENGDFAGRFWPSLADELEKQQKKSNGNL